MLHVVKLYGDQIRHRHFKFSFSAPLNVMLVFFKKLFYLFLFRASVLLFDKWTCCLCLGGSGCVLIRGRLADEGHSRSDGGGFGL